MNKINFQNGTKVTEAKVTIDGTDYEVTPATYSGTTPINNTNLNQLQTNIDTSKAELVKLITVSSTEPSGCTTGDKYYNTTTQLLYTAPSDNTWGTGETPLSNVLYLNLSANEIYVYVGGDLESYGGGSEITIDTEMSDTSENTVQNKVIKSYVDNTTCFKKLNSNHLIGIKNTEYTISDISGYDFLLFVAGASDGVYSRSSVLIPISDVTYHDVTGGNTWGISCLQSTTVLYQIEWKFRSSTLIRITNAAYVAWGAPSIISIYGIKMKELL